MFDQPTTLTANAFVLMAGLEKTAPGVSIYL